jgi:hypothetical protein
VVRTEGFTSPPDPLSSAWERGKKGKEKRFEPQRHREHREGREEREYEADVHVYPD